VTPRPADWRADADRQGPHRGVDPALSPRCAERISSLDGGGPATRLGQHLHRRRPGVVPIKISSREGVVVDMSYLVLTSYDMRSFS